jgi:hypothetical protein
MEQTKSRTRTEYADTISYHCGRYGGRNVMTDNGDELVHWARNFRSLPRASRRSVSADTTAELGITWTLAPAALFHLKIRFPPVLTGNLSAPLCCCMCQSPNVPAP